MTTEEFLRHVWPDTGPYCIHYTFVPREDAGYTGHANMVFGGYKAMLEFIEDRKKHSNFWFTVHVLKERKVLDANGKNHPRTKANMREARSFFFDLDVGDSEKKYASQTDAVRGLQEFIKATGLPAPTMVSSGYGVQVHWVVEDAIPTPEWVEIAAKMRGLAEHHGLKIDTSRTTDQSSVMRIPGTFNLKNTQDPKPVEVKFLAKRIPNEKFLQIVSDAVVANDVQVLKVAAPGKAKPKVNDFGLGSNIEPDKYPPVKLKTIVDFCGQTRRLVSLRGAVPEPEWSASLQLMMFLKNGDKLIHRISEGDPRYTPENVEARVQRLRDGEYGPTSCELMQHACTAKYCVGCPFEHAPKSNPEKGTKLGPLAFAHQWLKMKEAPPPIIEVAPDVDSEPLVIPPPPKPFKRLETGAISMRVEKDEENKSHDVVILDHDLYPVRRLDNSTAEKGGTVWCAKLPKDGEVYINIDAATLANPITLAGVLANRHVYVNPDNQKDVHKYMVAYIKELQKHAAFNEQHDHFGWTPDFDAFIMPERLFHANGKTTEAFLGGNAAKASYLTKAGDINEQIKMLDFFNGPENVRMQFLICASMGSPLMAFTPQHGAIVNAQGTSGTAKTTALKAAASIWGNPDRYIINGKEEGSTVKGRYDRGMTLCNLPFCMDEFTGRDINDIIGMAMGVTQSAARTTLTRNGEEKQHGDKLKASIALLTSNNSLVRSVEDDHTSGVPAALRMIEIPFPMLKRDPDMKARGDAMLIGLRKNHGHVGERLARYYVMHQAEIGERITVVSAEIEKEANLDTPQRIRVSGMACTIVACEIGNKLGLIRYDVVIMRQWLMNTLLPYMISELTVPDAIGALGDFLTHEHQNTLIVVGSPNAGATFSYRDPRGALHVRIDKTTREISISNTVLAKFCAARKQDLKELKDAWLKSGLVKHKDHLRARVVLSKGTLLPVSGQVYCVVLQMDHPELAGMVPEDDGVAQTGPQPASGNVIPLRAGA